MRRHQLGRKRVLDTLLAATYRAAEVTSLLTLNAADFTVFDELAGVLLPGAPACFESYRCFGELWLKTDAAMSTASKS